MLLGRVEVEVLRAVAGVGAGDARGRALAGEAGLHPDLAARRAEAERDPVEGGVALDLGALGGEDPAALAQALGGDVAQVGAGADPDLGDGVEEAPPLRRRWRATAPRPRPRRPPRARSACGSRAPPGRRRGPPRSGPAAPAAAREARRRRRRRARRRRCARRTGRRRRRAIRGARRPAPASAPQRTRASSRRALSARRPSPRRRCPRSARRRPPGRGGGRTPGGSVPRRRARGRPGRRPPAG